MAAKPARGADGERHLQAPRRVRHLVAIAVGVVAAVSGVFWLLDTVLILDRIAVNAANSAHLAWSIRGSALLVTSGMLAIVLGAVELVGLRLRLRRAAR